MLIYIKLLFGYKNERHEFNKKKEAKAIHLLKSKYQFNNISAMIHDFLKND